ncbi:hypothetical protein [Archaeoglobus sp.]
MNDTAAKIFKRELIGALLFYFPVMIITANLFMAAGIKIRPPFDLIILILPAIILVAIAYLRTRYYHGVEYKPNTKNLSALLAITSFMFLLERVVYSLLHNYDAIGIATFFIMFLLAMVWNRMSKDEFNPVAVAKMLLVASTLFAFIWSVFAAINRVLYSFIVLAAWLVVFVVSLGVLLKKGGG